MMRYIFIKMSFILLAGGTTVFGMSETDARQHLAAAGIELWPDDKKADYYRPPYSSLASEPDGTFRLYLRNEVLTNVAVLAEIPISDLRLECPQVSNLAPLAHLPLRKLSLDCHPDTDLSPLKGKPIRSLSISDLRIRDLSVLQGMPLEELWFNPNIVTNGLDLVASAPRLGYIVTCTPNNRRCWSKKEYLAKLSIWGFRPDSAGKPPGAASVLSEPLSICMTTYSGFTTASAWEFTVQADRQAVLMVTGYDERGKPASSSSSIRLSEEQFAAVRKAVVDNQFLALGTNYGDNIIDASSRSLSIRIGDYQKTILIRSLINRLVSNDSQLESAKQLLKIWTTLLSVTDIPKGCLNFSDEDERVLEWKAPNKRLHDTVR